MKIFSRGGAEARRREERVDRIYGMVWMKRKKKEEEMLPQRRSDAA